MKELINTFDYRLNIDLILFCALFATIIVSIKNIKKFKILRYIPVYSVSFILGLVVNRFSKDYPVPSKLLPLSTYLDYFITLLELIIFSHFYHQLIESRTVKRLIIVSNSLFVLFYIYMGVSDENFFYKGITEGTQSTVYTVEGIILLILCSYYFFELFKKLPVVNLKNEPVFWVSTGLFFFMTCTLPYSLIENYIEKHYPDFSFMLYSLYYLFYIILFIMIIRAYLCKPGMTS